MPLTSRCSYSVDIWSLRYALLKPYEYVLFSYSLKIKASHTRYWALGPELIPVQAVSPQVTISHPLGSRLPLLFARPAITCQPQGITAAWPVPSYTAWWQRQDCRTFCTTSSDCCRHLSITYVVNDISSYCLLKCIVSSSWWLVELHSSWHCLRLRCCQWEDDRCVQVHPRYSDTS